MGLTIVILFPRLVYSANILNQVYVANVCLVIATTFQRHRLLCHSTYRLALFVHTCHLSACRVRRSRWNAKTNLAWQLNNHSWFLLVFVVIFWQSVGENRQVASNYKRAPFSRCGKCPTNKFFFQKQWEPGLNVKQSVYIYIKHIRGRVQKFPV